MGYLIAYLLSVVVYFLLILMDDSIKTQKEKLSYAWTGLIPVINLFGIAFSISYMLTYGLEKDKS